MRIELPKDLDRFVQANLQSGRFASEEELVAAAVRLLRQSEHGEASAAREPGESGTANGRTEPAWQRVLEHMNEVPDAVFDLIPADSSQQLDHYLYGVPKRPEC